jgi:hypothetical protein
VVGLSQTNAKGTTAGWKKATGLNITIVASTTYWIAVQLDNTATATNMNQAVDAGEKQDGKGAQTTLTDPWAVSAASYGQLTGFYALYETTPAAGGAKNAQICDDMAADDTPPGLYY